MYPKNIIPTCSNLRKIQDGYFIFFFLLLGKLSISLVSPNNKVGWVPEYVILAPGPAILVSPTKQEENDCGNISVDDCMKKLQAFLKLKSLPFTAEESELNKLCSDTVTGYNCSATKQTGPNCMSQKDKDLVPIFTEMAQYAMFMFCASGDGQHGYLRAALLKYSDCILKQKDSLDCCSEQSKLVDFPVMYFLDQSSRSLAERQIAACCPVANYLKCAQTVINDKCGEIAANLTVEYVRRSSGAQMEAVCQEIAGYPEPNEEMCKTSPPVCSGTRVGIFAEITVLICLFFALWMNYV